MPAKKASFCRLIPLLFLALCSCVKDVDIDQIDQVVIPPKAELDLVYATLEANDFSRPANSTVYQVEDVVNLEFLDDEYIKNGLVRASFTFKYTNSFETEFTNTVSFLSKSNDVKYSFSFEVPAGTVEEPTV
ncbi:MAG TPA: hypothetical protein VFM60_07610, partial [Salinimicrobium sp.]|nr:hypothetical protein [Salinimicrobium sp.]